MFLRELTSLMDEKAPICFLDETTFVLTSMPKKLWQPREYDMRVPYTKSKYVSKTLYGSLSLVTNPPFIWTIASSTNQEDFRKFVSYVKTKLIRGYKTKILNLVFDRHSSHVCHNTRDWLAVKSRRTKSLIIPSSSSQFNCIETYFGILKNHYRKLLTKKRLHQKRLTPEDIVTCVGSSCAKITEAM